MSDVLIKEIENLPDAGIGDPSRLTAIIEQIKKGKQLYSSDLKYVDNLISKYLFSSEINSESRNVIDSSQINKKPSENQPINNKQQTNVKSVGVTFVLSFVLGLFAVQGIGHMYLGKIGKGFAILFAGISLLVLAFFCQFNINPTLGGVFFIGYLVMFIVQILDANNTCRKYNETVRKSISKDVMKKVISKRKTALIVMSIILVLVIAVGTFSYGEKILQPNVQEDNPLSAYVKAAEQWQHCRQNGGGAGCGDAPASPFQGGP